MLACLRSPIALSSLAVDDAKRPSITNHGIYVDHLQWVISSSNKITKIFTVISVTYMFIQYIYCQWSVNLLIYICLIYIWIHMFIYLYRERQLITTEVPGKTNCWLFLDQKILYETIFVIKKNKLRRCKFDIGHNIAAISNPSFNLSHHNLKNKPSTALYFKDTV